MVQHSTTEEELLRESRQAEMALIEAETRAERALVTAEERYRRALDKLARAQAKAEARRRAFEQARAQLDQSQLERSAGPLIRRVIVERPALPRPARDDSRARARAAKANGPTPEGAGPSKPDDA